MKNSVTLQVEKISNGFLFTTIKDNVASKKQYQESKTDFFKILKNDEAIGALIEDNDDIMMLEVIRHDVVTTIPEKTNKEALEEIVQRDVYNPFPTKKEEDELRLSITTTNCYTAEKLKEIDFIAMHKLVPLSLAKRAEICGVKEGTIINTWGKITKGKALFQSPGSRMYMTVLAKYYEKVTGIRSTKQDELTKLKEGIKKAIFGLDNIYKKQSHVHSNAVLPLLNDLKYLIGDKTNS